MSHSLSRFSFSLATQADNAQLRARMAENWINGNISISFRREPDYFAGCRIQGDNSQVIVCREIQTGKIIGLGSRSKSEFHMNGKRISAGYLSDLRGDPAFRNGTLLARGFKYLRKLHQEDPLPAYFTIIFDNNISAIQSLTGQRAGLPAYLPMGRILTPAIHLDCRKPEMPIDGINFRRGRFEDIPNIVNFLNDRLSTRQFSPVYKESDFMPGGRCSGLTPDDFYLAIHAGKIVGTVAAWDQKHIRQTHIEKYSPMLAAIRPVYNLASHISSLKPLPGKGCRIPYLYLCCIAINQDDINIFRALLRYTYNQLRTGPWHYAIAGLHEQDPLASVLSDYRNIPSSGLLYRVKFEDPPEIHIAVDSRPPYIEMALA